MDIRDFKGTQGEWTTRQNSNQMIGDHVEIIAPPQDGTNDHVNIICEMHDVSYKSKNDGGFYSQDSENQKANAALIAAAPDMLKALDELVHLHGCEQEGLQSGQPTKVQWLEAYNNGVTALEKALGVK